MISRVPGSAIYEQIAARLRADILTGRLAPGQPLPSERRLVQEHGVAQQTARRAIAVLRSEGLVVTRRGQSVMVREQPALQDLTPPAGSRVTSRMPSPEERTLHGIPEGVPVFWVIAPDGSVEVFPADRWQLRC